ncbi:MAG: DUF2157 domain-containing protein [Stigonema ocellatum SAG 48.90 = DSM 106950]|nr:DUF2157 domain-containing protein [Stigonema ocellatum SAG 48.90 = DSM 106950]
MSSNFDQPIKIEVRLPSSHPELLSGLDMWLRLGLISDAQVRQLCREFLVCSVVLQPQAKPEPQNVETLATSLWSTPPVATQPNILARMLQSLGAELSVRWLLFLGMFLVVVSSGVLAASQWEKFPPAAQYGVLLAYTLSFWGVSFWAGKQPNLLLTAQTLLIVTLLLVPVNFWAMDSFGLWQNPWEWMVVAAASVALTAITVLVWNNRRFVANKAIGKLFLVNILALSYLHWGWKIPGFPLIAIYLAMAGTTIATVSTAEEHRRTRLDLTLPSAVIIYGLVVLLVRGIFVVHLDIQELGLAIGVCGWLVAWLAQPQLKAGGDEGAISSSPLSYIGGILLFLGWLVSVGKAFPWQATCVSGLSLWFFRRRLQRYSVWTDVGAIFVIGLQTIWLVWRLVPNLIQEWAIATGTQLTNSQHTPWALLSVALFPYVIFMVTLITHLDRTQKVKLADFGEKLTLLFAILLTLVSLVNPTLRSLNLLFSTITLATFSHQRPTRISPVYLTQITGVLTLCSIIDRLLPHLSQEMWASILLAIAVAEWLLSLSNGLWQRSRDELPTSPSMKIFPHSLLPTPYFQVSGWYLGLGLAALSYSLLWKNAETSWFGSGNGNENWGLVWLITPVVLTYLASLGFKRITCTWLSVTTLGLSQLLTLPLPGARLIGLAIATALMLGNTYYLQQLHSAVITVGFGLGFVAALLWEGVPGLPHLSPSGWFLVGAISIISLWLVRPLLLWEGGETRRGAQIYAIAIDKWAIALCSLELLLLSVQCLLVYQGNTVYHIQGHSVYSSQMKTAITSSAITLGAIVYRSWQQPTNWGFYGIGWCLELLIAELLGRGDHSLIRVAIANIALGLTTQLLGEWWYRRHPLERLPNRWHILPLIYSVFGVVLRGHIFANWTGLSTIAVAFIAMGVGRRRTEFKPLVYLGLVGVSIGAYEILLYQILQMPGGVFGDRCLAMCVLGTGIMYAYRVLAPRLVDYLHLTTAELRVTAHIHWAVSSCLLLAACFTPISLKTVGLGTGVFLIRYAIFQGRQHSTSFKKRDIREISTSEFWVYLGLLEVACLRAYLPEIPIVHLFEKELLPWQVAIASIVSYFLYILPWETWGWDKKPWQRSAYILPLVFLWQTRSEVYPISLLIAAGFYIFVAKAADKFRFTYISTVLCNWALLNWFSDLNLKDALWYVTPVGLSVLYVAQFDPYLRLPEMKACRHWLRLLGGGVICGWAIIFHQDIAVIPGIFSLIAILAGLALRVRAFLYIGVATFFITGFYQLVVLSLRYPFFKWVIGLVVGIILISLAANFETRRQRLNSLLRNTSYELQEWE